MSCSAFQGKISAVREHEQRLSEKHNVFEEKQGGQCDQCDRSREESVRREVTGDQRLENLVDCCQDFNFSWSKIGAVKVLSRGLTRSRFFQNHWLLCGK